MKNLKIDLSNHQAVLYFKRISEKNYSTLKWNLIKQNIDEISEELARNLKGDGRGFKKK
jgi:hypothetical protein